MHLLRHLSRPAVLLAAFVALSVPALPAQETQPHGAGEPVQLWLTIPFLLLLLAIAVVPLIDLRGWHKNYPKISFTLGALVVLWYVLVRRDFHKLGHTGLEYVSFICLIGSLFVASGGILVRVERPGTPPLNTFVLLLGAVLANVFGTTGASAILIRPFLRINRGHIRPYHVVFFIFIVSNCGGALTPIGDPPLFMGYIKGVPFWWIAERAWPHWTVVCGALLAIFFAIDTWDAKRRPGPKPEIPRFKVEFVGSQNFLFIGAILVAVFLIEALEQHGIPELIMAGAAIASHKTTPKRILAENEFHFEPIREVAILFAGIFATMIPALQYLEQNAAALGVASPGAFFWGTGFLSAVLDNTPTYLNFLAAAMGEHGWSLDNREHVALLLAKDPAFLVAVSMGAVFFGAATYIGNGPNFMVKGIAEHAGVRCPSFFGYVVRYTVPVLLPLFFVVWLLFFRS